MNDDKSTLSSASIKILKRKLLSSDFSPGNGAFRTNDQVLVFPGLKRSEFDLGIGQHMDGKKFASDYVVYGPISVVLWGRSFSLGLRFSKDVVQGVTLALEQGRVATFGYDTTEDDLLTEKKTLTAMISSIWGARLHRRHGADVFEFPWGGVVSRADQKSTWCGIEIWYKY